MKKEYVVNFTQAKKCEIEVTIRNLSKILFKYPQNRNLDEMKQLFNDCKEMRYSAQAYIDMGKESGFDADILVSIGYMRSMLDCLQLWIEDLEIQNHVERLEVIQRQILIKVYQHTEMTDIDLSQEFGIEADKVNKVVSGINKGNMKMIAEDRCGNMTVYSITPKAYMYFNKITES